MNLWRYLDLAKFVALLQTQELHFTRGDKFDDPFEGSYPCKNVDAFKPRNISYSAEDWRKFAAVSCWYASDIESDAMWRLYNGNRQGVAIRTTWRKLAIAADDANLEIVRYLDFVTEPAEIRIPSDVFKYKRKAYAHEKEVRAILTKYPPIRIDNGVPQNSLPISGQEFSETGEVVELSDLSNFLEQVVVSPYSDSWFADVVKGLAQKYELAPSIVVRSELRADPIYARITR